jgi:hypothetical protein
MKDYYLKVVLVIDEYVLRFQISVHNRVLLIHVFHG